jgi:hypothetical protein
VVEMQHTIALTEILEEMVSAARRQDAHGVESLNCKFEDAYRAALENVDSANQLAAFDRCREACVGAVNSPQFFDVYMGVAQTNYIALPRDSCKSELA